MPLTAGIGYVVWGKLPTSPVSRVAFEFNVEGWEDYDGERHEGKPLDIDDTWGELVHAYDPDTETHEYFWAFVPQTFEDWEQWIDYIETLMDMYGMEMV